jgi:RNA polymerase sigma-70 factor (ECF subfamily)
MAAAPALAVFERTMLPHLDAAYNLARWLTRNEDDAQDVVQEAYLRAFRFFDGFRGGDGRAWLLAIVRNTAWTWLRRERALTQVSFDEEVHGSGGEAATVEGKLVEGAKFAQLQEMPYRDIAEAASVPIGTVMSRLSRARQRLQDCLTARMKEASK